MWSAAYIVCSIAIAATAHTWTTSYLPSLQLRQFRDLSDYPLLHARAGGSGKRPAGSSDSRGQAKVPKIDASSGRPQQQQRSRSASPQSGQAKGKSASAKDPPSSSGRGRDKSPSPSGGRDRSKSPSISRGSSKDKNSSSKSPSPSSRGRSSNKSRSSSNYRTYSTDSSDLENFGYTSTMKATVRGQGKLQMKPGSDTPIKVNEESRITQKVRAPAAEARISTKKAVSQPTHSEVVLKGSIVQASMRPKTAGTLEAWGAEGPQRIHVRPGEKQTLSAQGTFDKNGDPIRRARIKATLPDGGKVHAAAGQYLSNTGGDNMSDSDSS